MSKILFDENPLVIDTTLAKVIGLNEAIIVQQIHYWLEINKKKALNFIDGKYWTYNSIKKWHEEHFSFWVEKTVKRTFSSLVEKGLLITANYNKSKFDKSLWYSIDYEKLSEIVKNFNENKEDSRLGQNVPIGEDKKSQSKGTKSPNGEGQIDQMEEDNLTQPIPETYTETSTEISTETSSSSSSEGGNDDDGIPRESDFNNSDFQEIINCFNNNIHPVTPMEAQKLSSWHEDVEKEVIIYSIESAVMYNARNMGYISKVFNNLINAGVKTKEGLEAYIRDFEDKKNRKNIGQGKEVQKPNDEYAPDIKKLIESQREKSKELVEKYKDWTPPNYDEVNNNEQGIFDRSID
ncbi:DnaD domain-containing protein [Clostridium cylindrosporum]|uniref:DnaD and phage-associated domain n=1 Tax=Clostridium cylindrosporum DSM 605 TaxID=1121307 RepID=A0A0J8DAV4_CLOCY|nr:DnaD domain protein [Clostridium cylindrosporum]KMT22982.1 DnaD and phage-associated domain [Clostridium cylindrosporum DSM 605]